MKSSHLRDNFFFFFFFYLEVYFIRFFFFFFSWYFYIYFRSLNEDMKSRHLSSTIFNIVRNSPHNNASHCISRSYSFKYQYSIYPIGLVSICFNCLYTNNVYGKYLMSSLKEEEEPKYILRSSSFYIERGVGHHVKGSGEYNFNKRKKKWRRR